MSENYKMKKIGVTALCRISAKGGEGVYLYIPRNYADAYGIAAAEYAEVKFGQLFFKVAPEKPVKSKVKDWRDAPRKKAGVEVEDDLTQGELG